MNRIHRILSLLFLTGCLVLASCAATPQAPQASDPPTGIHEISALYEQVTAYHRREFRRTVKDHKARELRLLAEKADQLLAATSDWDNDARLTGASAADKNAAREKVRSFHAALQGLKDAANRGDMKAVDDNYAAVMAGYHEVAAVAMIMD